MPAIQRAKRMSLATPFLAIMLMAIAFLLNPTANGLGWLMLSTVIGVVLVGILYALVRVRE